MKKTLSVFSLIAALFTFVSCASMSGIDYKEAAETGSPEDTVVFYGGFTNTQDYRFSQRDSNFPADFQYLEHCDEVFVSAPVAPGSTYTIEYFGGAFSSGYVTWVFGRHYPLNFHNFDFQIPKKPGLYYLGYFDGVESYKNGEFKKAKFLLKSDKSAELDALKVALKVYKGTAWEPVIQKKIDEVNK